MVRTQSIGRTERQRDNNNKYEIIIATLQQQQQSNGIGWNGGEVKLVFIFSFVFIHRFSGRAPRLPSEYFLVRWSMSCPLTITASFTRKFHIRTTTTEWTEGRKERNEHRSCCDQHLKFRFVRVWWRCNVQPNKRIILMRNDAKKVLRAVFHNNK